jgi:hypothetical protein
LPWFALLRRRRALRFLVFFDIGVTGYRSGGGASQPLRGLRAITLRPALGGATGDSYSWEILPHPVVLSAEAMLLVRVLMGLNKLVMDVASLSPLGFRRDAIGLFAPILNAQVDEAADAIVDGPPDP